MKWFSMWVVALAGFCALDGNAASFYAARNGQTPGSFTSWTTAASNIQEAVDAAAANDTVWVGPGVYTLPSSFTNYDGPNVVFINKPLRLCSSNSSPETTIIDGGGANRGIMWNYNTTTSNRFLIDGLTITNCYADSNGGGIYLDPQRPSAARAWTGEVYNCVIVNNTAGTNGGGVYAYASTGLLGLKMSNCVIRSNTVLTNSGGGVFYSAVGAGLISNCRFENNMATNGGGNASGGGVCSTKAQPLTFENCVFVGNGAGANSSAGVGGGALRCSGAGHQVILRNCLMYNNVGNRGGAINFQTDFGYLLEVHNSTIVSNTTTSGYAAGIYLRSGGGIFRMFNSIVVSNRVSGGTLANIFVPAPTNWLAEVTNSCTFPTNDYVTLASGNITNDPQFANFADQDFHPLRSSPCVNTGTNEPWTLDAVDLDGNPRVDLQGPGIVDMGCFEFPFIRGSFFEIR